MLPDLSKRIKAKLPSFLYDKYVDETTPIADTIILTVIALLASALLSGLLPLPLSMFIVYTFIVYLAAILNQRYRVAERAHEKEKAS